MNGQLRWVFGHALDVISQKGWLQKKLFDTESGARCALGGILYGVESVLGVDACQANSDQLREVMNLRREAHIMLAAVLEYNFEGDPDGDPYTFIAEWNDDPVRTKDDVLQALRSAAERVNYA